MPSPRSFSRASRTGVTLTPSSAAVSSRRMNVPGGNIPDMIAARKWPATSSDNCARRSGRRVLGLVDSGAFTGAARAFQGLAGLKGVLSAERQSHSVTHTTPCFIKYQPGASGARGEGEAVVDRAVGQPSGECHRAAVSGSAAELGQPTRAARADAAERDGPAVPGQDRHVGWTPP